MVHCCYMVIIGHRGARGLAPENTVAAIQKALDADADEIEVDVRVSKDGIAVLHHDPQLTYPGGVSLKINELTVSELRRYRADLATLDDAIMAIDRKLPLIIEVKPDEPVDGVIETVRLHLAQGWSPSHFRFASFSQRSLIQLHRALPEIVPIVNERWSGIRANWRAHQLDTKRITMNQRWLWSGFIRAARHSGTQLSAYTVNDQKKAQRWATYGLWGVITDCPDQLRP